MPVPQPRPRPLPTRIADGAGEAAFLDRLKNILGTNGGAAQAGRINVIGLDRIKAKLGERWDGLSERVHTVARAAIEKSVQPQDVWTTCGNSYVIAFASMNIEEARAKCRIIAQIIESALLGEADGHGVSVATAVATVDGQVLLRDLPTLDAMLARAPAATPTAPPAASPAAAPPEGRRAPSPSPSRDDARRDHDSAWSTIDAHRTRDTNPWPAVEEQRGRDANPWPTVDGQRDRDGKTGPTVEEPMRMTQPPGPWVAASPPRAVAEPAAPWNAADPRYPAFGPEDRNGENQAWRTMAPPVAQGVPFSGVAAPAAGPASTPPENLEVLTVDEDTKDEIVWEPVWDVRNERIPMYRAKYVRNSRVWLQPSEELVMRADFAVRDATLRELTGCLVQSRYILLGLPVRFWTIASYARRRAYLAAMSSRVSPASRKFLLIFVTEVPDGVPVARLMELLGALRPFCREIFVEMPVQTSDFSALAGARVSAVGTDLGSSTEPERVQMQQIDQFARSAAKAGLANYCLAGVESVPLVTAAIAAGFRFISGNAIGALAAQVSNVRPLSLDYVYRANVEAKGLRWPNRGVA